MEERDYLDLIGRHLAEGLSTPEHEQLLQWIAASPDNRRCYEEAERLWALAEEQPPPSFAQGKGEAWTKLEERIDRRSTKVRSMGAGTRWLRYAAALAALLIAAYGLYTFSPGEPQWTEVYTQAEEQQTIELPDGSRISLNENSRVRYPAKFESRHVVLEGEAFFEVAKRDGQPFTVQSGESLTKVLGTSFNIRAYPAEAKVSVSVQTGLVAVSAAETEAKLELQAGQSAVYDERQQSLGLASVSNALAWKRKQLQFEDTRLEETLDALERYFGQTIKLEASEMAKCRFTGTFPEPALEEVLTAIAFTMELELLETEGQLSLSGSGEGCE